MLDSFIHLIAKRVGDFFSMESRHLLSVNDFRAAFTYCLLLQLPQDSYLIANQCKTFTFGIAYNMFKDIDKEQEFTCTEIEEAITGQRLRMIPAIRTLEELMPNNIDLDRLAEMTKSYLINVSGYFPDH